MAVNPLEQEVQRRARLYDRYRQPAPPELQEFAQRLTGRPYQAPVSPEFERSFFERPVETIFQGLDYTGRDIGQHFDKPFAEAAGGVAGALANAGLDILSFIPREVSPVLVGGGRRLVETGQLPSTFTEAKRFGQETKKSVIASIPDIGEADLGLFKVNLPGATDILYDVLTDPTIFLFGAGLAMKGGKLATFGEAMKWTAIAPGLPITVPLDIFGKAIGATGLLKLSPKGQLNRFMRGFDTAMTEIERYEPADVSRFLAGQLDDSPLSTQTREVIKANQPLINDWMKKAKPDFADVDAATQSLMASVNTAKRAELKIEPPTGIGKIKGDVDYLLKQAWLGVNPAYPLANLLDAMPKVLFGLNWPFVRARIVENLGLDTAARRVGGYTTFTAATLGEGRKPILTGAAASEIERLTRSAVYIPKLAREARPALRDFLDNVEAELVKDADPSAVRAGINILRAQRDFDVKRFLDVMGDVPRLQLNKEVLNELPQASVPGFEDIIREMADDLLDPKLKATPKTVKAAANKAITKAEQRLRDTESLLDYYRNQSVKEAGEALGKLSGQILDTLSDYPNEASGAQLIAMLYETFRLQDYATKQVHRIVRAQGKSFENPAWHQFGQAMQQMADSAAELVPNLTGDLAQTPLPELADDLRAFVVGYRQLLDRQKAAVNKAIAAGTAPTQAWQARAVEMNNYLQAAYQMFVKKYSGFAAAYGTIEKTVAGSPLRQYREQTEELIRRRILDETSPLVDEQEALAEFRAIIDDWSDRVTQPKVEVPPSAAEAPSAAQVARTVAQIQKDEGVGYAEAVRIQKAEAQTAAAPASQVGKQAEAVIPPPPAKPTIPEVAVLEKAQLSRDQWEKKLNGMASDLSTRIQKAHEAAEQLTNDKMFNYGDETMLDRYLRTISPFTVWQLRNIPFWIRELATYPGGRQIATQINDALEASQKEIEQRNLTRRMQRTQRIGQIDVGTGPLELRAEPYAPFISAAQQMTDPFVLTSDDDELGPQGATQFGAAMQTLLRFAGGLSVYPYISIPLQLMGTFGETPFTDILPTSRAIRGIGELTGADLSGLDIERNIVQPNLRRFGETIAEAEIPGIPGRRETSITGDIFRDEQIRRRIGEIGRREGLDLAAMLRAMDDPDSALFARARREVEREENLRGAARLLAPITIKTLTPGEASLREAKGKLPPYNPDQESDEYQLRVDMLNKDSGLSAYLNRFDHPAVRQIKAEMNEFYQLGDKAARERLDATPEEGRRALYESDPKVAEVSRLRREYRNAHPALDGYFDRDREATPKLQEYVQAIITEPVVSAKVSEAVGKAGREESPGLIRSQEERKAVEEAGKPTEQEAQLERLLAEYAALKVPRYDEYYGYDPQSGARDAFRQRFPAEYAAIRAAAAARMELILDNDILAQWYAFRDKEKWKQGGDERFKKALADGLVMSPAAARAYIKKKPATQNLTSARQQPYRVEPLLARQVRRE